jgi:16S rRNA (guanine966-N2)-methyltransferase
VEQDPAALAAIRANVEALGASERCRVLARSAEALPASKPFDMLLADPPYSEDSGSTALRQMASWVGAGSWIAIETQRGKPVEAGAFAVEAERDVGRARITLLRA